MSALCQMNTLSHPREVKEDPAGQMWTTENYINDDSNKLYPFG